jgi:hypothetical protein
MRTTPGLPAVVKISRKKLGVSWALLGVLGALLAGWWGAWLMSFIFLAVMSLLAVLFYFGISRESNVSVTRGRVFVYPKKIGIENTALSESICRPEAIKEVGDVVLVFSRWSELRIVFQNETLRASFMSEVSSLVKS